MTKKSETVIQHAARLHNAKLDTEVIAERMAWGKERLMATSAKPGRPA